MRRSRKLGPVGVAVLVAFALLCWLLMEKALDGSYSEILPQAFRVFFFNTARSLGVEPEALHLYSGLIFLLVAGYLSMVVGGGTDPDDSSPGPSLVEWIMCAGFAIWVVISVGLFGKFLAVW